MFLVFFHAARWLNVIRNHLFDEVFVKDEFTDQKAKGDKVEFAVVYYQNSRLALTFL